MNNAPDQFTIAVSRNELEVLLRRVVRGELTCLLKSQRHHCSISRVIKV